MTDIQKLQKEVAQLKKQATDRDKQIDKLTKQNQALMRSVTMLEKKTNRNYHDNHNVALQVRNLAAQVQAILSSLRKH